MRIIGKLADVATYDIKLWIFRKSIQLSFKPVRHTYIIRVHPGHKLIRAMLYAFSKGKTEPAVFFKLYRNKIYLRRPAFILTDCLLSRGLGECV